MVHQCICTMAQEPLGTLGISRRHGAGNPHEIVSGWVSKFVDHS